MLVAFVPGRVHQLLEGGECLMDRIARELRIGDVPLNTHDAQFGTEGTTATDSNNIAQHLAARWFADDAPIHALFARQEAIHDCAGPVKSGAFFVGREQEGNPAGQVWSPLEQALDGNDHGRQAALHVRRTAAVNVLRIYDRVEGWPVPSARVPRRHHVRVSGEDECRSGRAAMGPQVVDVFGRHSLQREAERLEALADEALTVCIVRRHRGLADQLRGECDDRVLAVLSCLHGGPRSIRSRIGWSGIPNVRFLRCG